MKLVSLVAILAVICISGTTMGATNAPQERLVKDVSLQSFFHTQLPWRLKIYEPASGDAEAAERAVRVCFTLPGSKRVVTKADCTALYAPTYVRSVTYPCQAFESAELRMLPGADGRSTRPSLVVRADYSGGGAGALQAVFVWIWQDWSHGMSTKPGDWFLMSFESDTTERGQQEFVKEGPLEGLFVSVDQIVQFGDTLESPMRFEVEVYAPDAIGYTRVLALLSEKRYPSNHTDKGTPDPIAVLTPEIARALEAVYPNGVLSVLRH